MTDPGHACGPYGPHVEPTPIKVEPLDDSFMRSADMNREWAERRAGRVTMIEDHSAEYAAEREERRLAAEAAKPQKGARRGRHA